MSFPRLLDTTLSAFIGSRARERTPLLVKRVEEIIATDGARISFVTMFEIDRGLRRLEAQGKGGQRDRHVATSGSLIDGSTVRGHGART
jgi:hypothetical protein